MKSQGTLLLADDEDTFLEATEELLIEEGFHCHTVKNAHELSQALHEKDFDLLITDLNMPGNHVLEMVDEIRVSTQALPVIIVTGYPSIPTAVESVRLNVLEYMIKPVDYPKLLDAIKRGLQHKQVLQSVRMARQEVAQRDQQLGEIEETLRVMGDTVHDADLDETAVTSPNIIQLQRQVEGLSRTIAQNQKLAQSEQEPPALIADYIKLRDGLYETIQVLQRTKGSFRSKELARHRMYIESLLRDTEQVSKDTAE